MHLYKAMMLEFISFTHVPDKELHVCVNNMYKSLENHGVIRLYKAINVKDSGGIKHSEG